jgi:hypothetical protein
LGFQAAYEARSKPYRGKVAQTALLMPAPPARAGWMGKGATATGKGYGQRTPFLPVTPNDPMSTYTEVSSLGMYSGKR